MGPPLPTVGGGRARRRRRRAAGGVAGGAGARRRPPRRHPHPLRLLGFLTAPEPADRPDDPRGPGVRDPGHPRRASPPTRPPARWSRPIYQTSTFAQEASASTRATSTPARATRPAPRSRRAWPRSRARRTGSPSPAGWPPRTPCCGCCDPATTSCCPTTPTAARPARAQVHAPAGLAVDAGRPDRPGRGRGRAGGDETRMVVGRDADQPAAGDRRHRRGRPAAPTSGGALVRRSTTRSPRRTCSSRSRSAPTWSCTRPPSTSAATPTWSAGSSPLERRDGRGTRLPAERGRAPCPARSTASSSSGG